ncbi:YciI family protein [Leifsonia sp. F6_8S_P_1B]|uniref:YciI family protein n=1 Tax=Leifsonia williamsii TaxID=3035919 RepID=A0ABT8KDN0_9MICO|nr:YciI family protein [Leifsonia williamsii]MDN4614896.1 YciI family protein [Leifsonia williamsii]
MTQYLLSVIQPDGPIPEPEVMDVIERDVTDVNADMRAAGVWVFSGGLLPPATATVVRPSGGELLVTDGPFAEAKEFLGGFTIVDVPDLDAALEWGRRVAAATTLPIEVRPFAG